eukprot:12326750-Heterocapsa_arctica.AAC.1
MSLTRMFVIVYANPRLSTLRWVLMGPAACGPYDYYHYYYYYYCCHFGSRLDCHLQQPDLFAS